MRVLITGSDGFIGQNLKLWLEEKKIEVFSFTRKNNFKELPSILKNVQFIFHLAGVNRSEDLRDFSLDNTKFTEQLCEAIKSIKTKIPIVYSSSIQAESNSNYGKSKLAAEKILINFKDKNSNPVFIYRLPNVFGKWSRPNYNSVVATFCYNIIHNQSINIHNPKTVIQIVYIDDLIKSFISKLKNDNIQNCYVDIAPVYKITLEELSKQLYRFKNMQNNLFVETVGNGLVRALYSTYISYLPTENFTYSVKQHEDIRGKFVEVLKTKHNGQFSFITVNPGFTRGGHYHHSKTEKFLVVEGKAKFRFCHLITGQYYEISITGDQPKIVETIPGWSHDITNIGEKKLTCILWANEIFDKNNPDTYECPININN